VNLRALPLAVGVGLACLYAVAFARQVPPSINNPSAVTFTASADHSAIESYEADILRPDGSVLQTLNLGKPTPDAAGTITVTLNVQPIAFAQGYRLRLSAKVGTARSDYALSENTFNRVPGAPSKVAVK
jgi:hypothetical protein